MSINVVTEAKRCLNCKNPMCRQGCPIATNIPTMIQMFLHNQKDEAGEMLFRNNPLSVVCSLVCNHEKQCEGHCILGRKGESLGHVHFAIDYLTNPDVYDLGKSIAVIGAGNSAMDAARTALRKGVRQVSMLCRRSHAAANVRELEYAIADGVEMMYGCRPVEITDEGVVYQKAELDDQDQVLSLGEPQLLRCDSVIVAVSQGALNRIVSTTKGLNTTDKGLLTADDKGSTTRPGVFAGGDVVLGAKTVVEAVHFSKEVAYAMDRYLQSLREKAE